MRSLGAICFIAIFTVFGAHAMPPEPVVKLVPGVFKMRNINSPDRPNPRCPLYFNLVLDQAEMTGPFAVTSMRMHGFCDMVIFPDETYYRLNYVSTSCGSHTFEGQRHTEAGFTKVTINDHRARLCYDRPVDQIELTLAEPEGQITNFVSY
ncbi:MAG: hypothetical protein IPK68_20335 [Bdellovibrionales bacterium]|nr:hypothetical protein [Bdellovibrionales bacterium]